METRGASAPGDEFTEVDARPAAGARRRWPRWVLTVVVVLGVGAAGWWAGRATVGTSPTAGAGQPEPVTVTARTMSLGRSIGLNVVVSRPYRVVATNHLTGVVTAASSGDRPVAVGGTVYAVAGVPVRAVVGAVPFYRDLHRGDSGDDVAELQRALAALGFFDGSVSGTFDAATETAVGRWQTSLHLTSTGKLALGEVVAVPTLPAPLRLGEAITVGGDVSGGEPAVSAQSGPASFHLVLNDQQGQSIPSDAKVSIPFEGKTWTAVQGEPTQDQYGNTDIVLTAPGGGPVCGDDCHLLPNAEQTTLRAAVHLVPAVSGPAVPVAAIHTAANGSSYVLDDRNRRVTVTVLASENGMAVVSGLSDGATVLIAPDSNTVTESQTGSDDGNVGTVNPGTSGTASRPASSRPAPTGGSTVVSSAGG